MSIVVTGCAGFIGSHLSQVLLKQGQQVIGIDNFDPYYPRSHKEKNCEYLFPDSNFKFYEGDFADTSLMSDIFKRHSISTVLHLAARPGVQPSLNSSLDVLKENVEKTLTLLEEMKRSDVKKIIFASSSSIYGNAPAESFDEEIAYDWAISPYATSKQAAELYLKLFHNLHGFSCTALRFFSVYGPRQRPDMAINKFLKANLKGHKIELYNHGHIARDYTYIDDIVQGIVLSLKQIETTPSSYRCYNLGNHQRVSLLELMEIIQALTGKKTLIECRGPVRGDASATCANISKAQNELGYSPQTPLIEGLKRQLDWIKNSK